MPDGTAGGTGRGPWVGPLDPHSNQGAVEVNHCSQPASRAAAHGAASARDTPPQHAAASQRKRPTENRPPERFGTLSPSRRPPTARCTRSRHVAAGAAVRGRRRRAAPSQTAESVCGLGSARDLCACVCVRTTRRPSHVTCARTPRTSHTHRCAPRGTPADARAARVTPSSWHPRAYPGP